MTDRELLESAAKAAGIPIGKWVDWWIDSPEVGFWLDGDNWNPLTDDGDALRLAVKLRIDFCIAPNEATACAWCGAVGEFMEEPLAPYEMAATRRAIVRAAAEMAPK